MERIDKENYYLDIAQTVAERATCLRRCYGAILVKSDEIIATGYNGAPRGRKNCVDLNYCTREALNIPSGERYELCRSVHAEANAIISAARSETLGATLYMACVNPATGELHVPAAHHQRRHPAGGHPGHPHRLLRGPRGGLDPGGRLPPRPALKPHYMRPRTGTGPGVFVRTRISLTEGYDRP